MKPEALLHRLWTKAVGTADYAKEEWMRLEALLLEVEAETLERAAKLLDDEVADHLRERDEGRNPNKGGPEHTTESFCDEYGCSTLVEFAEKIRALKEGT